MKILNDAYGSTTTLDSFFFNITDTSYKVEGNRVDISNGIVFLNIQGTHKQHIKNLDRLIMIVVVKEGSLSIHEEKEFTAKESDIYISTRQDFHIDADGDIFILFIADFFLKRYKSARQNEPIDFLLSKLQQEISLERIGTKPLDALSLYLIDKITQKSDNMQSIRCEQSILEFMVHRFSLLDIVDESISQEERVLAGKAKSILLKNCVNPPSIHDLAHLCATNESKLKKLFKKVYKTTIYSYIQKLHLEKANTLLKTRALNIGEIAKEVGYKHQGHFSKLFFEHYGVYPKDLLKV